MNYSFLQPMPASKQPATKPAITIALVTVLSAVTVAAIYLLYAHRAPTVRYKGKPLEVWFYGSRTNFYADSTSTAATEAFKAVGTNAFPFLVSNLKYNHGNSVLYEKMHRHLPPLISTRLPYPISDDDIKVKTALHGLE
jgi:hypothetical protein